MCVVDNGSFMIKAGLAGSDVPKLVFSQTDRDIPIESGIVQDWANMEKVIFMNDRILKKPFQFLASLLDTLSACSLKK